MKFAKYWSALTVNCNFEFFEKNKVTIWGASNQTKEAADTAAKERAELFRAFFSNPKSKSAEYEYFNGFVREQVLEEIYSDSGELLAVITRNHYGAKILNTDKVFFGDIDIKPVGLFGRFLSIFGIPVKDKNYFLGAIERTQKKHAKLSFYVYETHSGLRLVVTNQFLEADAALTRQLFSDLGVDPLYKILCYRQKCFRARLTPKSWRIGIERRSFRYPFADQQCEREASEWVLDYESVAKSYGVVKLLARFGNYSIPADINKILVVHDRCIARINQSLA